MGTIERRRLPIGFVNRARAGDFSHGFGRVGGDVHGSAELRAPMLSAARLRKEPGGEVGIVGNRFLNPLNETWSLDRHALVQLILKSRVTRGGHRELSHRSLLSVGYSECAGSRQIHG